MKELKKFLKPDLRKIVVFAIIAIISWCLLYFTFILVGETIPVWLIAINFVLWLPLFIFYLLMIGSASLFIDIYTTGIIAWVFSIFYWYLLSCLIVFGYNKFRKRTK
jgi:hypothetical protein